MNGWRQRSGASWLLRFIVIALLLAVPLAVESEVPWAIFRGQVNGPAKPAGIDLATFRHRAYPGIFWSECYYHHLNFPDGSMITVQLGFNSRQTSLIFVYGKPGQKPVKEFILVDLDEAAFAGQGFSVTIGPNRFWLEGNQYHMNLAFGQVKAKMTLAILGGSYSYGDSMVRYPDGKSFTYYTLPIPWARAHVEAVIQGKTYTLDGYGNMNHDAQVLSPMYTPSKWQVFWFFGADHALAVTDFTTHREFGEVPVQRLVWVDKTGRMFTSTSFHVKWDDWVEASDIPFRYPRHYKLVAEAQGAKLEVEVRGRETLLREDLFSNLPAAVQSVVRRLTRNGWTYDCWSDYAATYTAGGQSTTYRGRGVVRYMDLEKE